MRLLTLSLILIIGCKEDMLLPQHGYFGTVKEPLRVLIIGHSIARGNSSALGPFTFATQWDAANSTIIDIKANDLLEAQAAGGSQWPTFANEVYRLTGKKVQFCNTAIGGSGYRYDADQTVSWYTGHDCWDNAVIKARNWLNYVGAVDPDLVIVQLGINDVNKSPMTTTYADMTSLIDRINTEYNTPRILMVQENATSTLLSTFELVNNGYTMRKYQKQLMVDYANVELSIGTNTLLTWGGFFQADGVHLNASGNSFLAARLARHVSLSTTIHKAARFWISNLYFDPSTTRRGWLHQFAVDLEAEGILYDFDALHVMATMGTWDGSNDYKNSAMDWAMGISTATINNVSVINYLGYQGNASTDRFIIGQASMFANNADFAANFMAGMYVGTVTSNSGAVAALFGVRENAATGIIVVRSSGGGALEWCSGDGATDSNGAEGAFASNSHYAVARSASGGTNNKHLIKNASVVSTVTRASAALAPGTNQRAFMGGAWNNNGTDANYINARLRCLYVIPYNSTNLTNLNTIMSGFLTNWLTNVQ